MEISTMEDLYLEGKRIYETQYADAKTKAEDIENTGAKIHKLHEKDIADSSAKHYLELYTDLRNQTLNTYGSAEGTICYFLKRIIQDESSKDAFAACQGAIKIARYRNKQHLEEKIRKIMKDGHIEEEARTEIASVLEPI